MPATSLPASGLGHRDRAHHLAAQRRREVLALQLVGAVPASAGVAIVACTAMAIGTPPHVGPAELLAEDERVRVVGALPPYSGSYSSPSSPSAPSFGNSSWAGKIPSRLPLVGVRVDLVLDDLPHDVAELLVLRGEPHPRAFPPAPGSAATAPAHRRASVRTTCSWSYVSPVLVPPPGERLDHADERGRRRVAGSRSGSATPSAWSSAQRPGRPLDEHRRAGALHQVRGTAGPSSRPARPPRACGRAATYASR